MCLTGQLSRLSRSRTQRQSSQQQKNNVLTGMKRASYRAPVNKPCCSWLTVLKSELKLDDCR
jgi:hypothetical protein